jgi:hypothetical protein
MTGTKAGVSITPCGVCIRPMRAAKSVYTISKGTENLDDSLGPETNSKDI